MFISDKLIDGHNSPAHTQLTHSDAHARKLKLYALYLKIIEIVFGTVAKITKRRAELSEVRNDFEMMFTERSLKRL